MLREQVKILILILCFLFGMSLTRYDVSAQTTWQELNEKLIDLIDVRLAQKEAKDVPYNILRGFYREYDQFWDDAKLPKKTKYIIKLNKEIMARNKDLRKAFQTQYKRQLAKDKAARDKKLREMEFERKKMLEKLEKDKELMLLKVEREKKRHKMRSKLRNRID